ncbi:hypothetical protein [Desulfovibrio litoralis]|uniref:Thioredoxin domain-containing protein n=1 Tax=Desulfovibrio litoralis DSM 11393 TaxID=1121455 RepID=A0A1M7SMR9_9BACT|nr:hypothetical protein [Desulfovibrio litoralis]SHN59762.1 hypothetical protein SAMN02745728_01049 [Desulfovibrio litoralis DSM 11393]
MKTIIVWDESADRINEMQISLPQALKVMGIKARIQWNSEPPLLSRMQLFGTTPAIEIDGEFWRHTIGKAVSEKEFIELLEHVANCRSCCSM